MKLHTHNLPGDRFCRAHKFQIRTGRENRRRTVETCDELNDLAFWSVVLIAIVGIAAAIVFYAADLSNGSRSIPEPSEYLSK